MSGHKPFLTLCPLAHHKRTSIEDVIIGLTSCLRQKEKTSQKNDLQMNAQGIKYKAPNSTASAAGIRSE
jgi:hypothetical protein